MSGHYPMFDIPQEVPQDVSIHPTAIVEKGAQLGRGVQIGAYATIGPDVTLEDGVVIHNHGVVEGKTTVGERTVIYSFATIGSKPQDLKYRNEPSKLVVGKFNSLRQYVNISVGTADGGMCTQVGDNNLLMVGAHVGHDSKLGDTCVLANGVSLAGHVTIADRATIGGHCAIHQFCRVDTLVIAAGGAIITQDVPPYLMVHGNRASPNGINVIGLKRFGLTASDLRDVKLMYKLTFKSGKTLAEAATAIQEEVPQSPCRDRFLTFIRSDSPRGICR